MKLLVWEREQLCFTRERSRVRFYEQDWSVPLRTLPTITKKYSLLCRCDTPWYIELRHFSVSWKDFCILVDLMKKEPILNTCSSSFAPLPSANLFQHSLCTFLEENVWRVALKRQKSHLIRAHTREASDGVARTHAYADLFLKFFSYYVMTKTLSSLLLSSRILFRCETHLVGLSTLWDRWKRTLFTQKLHADHAPQEDEKPEGQEHVIYQEEKSTSGIFSLLPEHKIIVTSIWPV